MAEANGPTVHAEPEAPVNETLEEPQPAEAEEPVRIPKGLYFVRVPRPEFDETATKHLQDEISKQITKLKAINSKTQVKRGEANAIRQQLADARNIRDGSKPDYESKLGRIKELQDMRKSYIDRIAGIRDGQKGLDVRTEEELDAKIASLEQEISSGSASLREEKQIVAQISKLRAQRDKVREFQAAQGDLSQLDAELKRVKAILGELQDEFKIITGERDQVKDIIGDLQAKLKTVTDAMSYLDSERQEIEAHKQELQEQLRAAREETDTAMAEYRENRKLSLQLRDLVDAGQLAEAAKLASEQVEAYLLKLNGDAVYRKDYVSLWCQQRKYLVSELLPKSGVVASAPSAAAGKAGGKPGSNAPAAYVPQGAAKAQAAIAAAMEAADLELAAHRRAAPVAQASQVFSSNDEDDEEEEPEPAAAATAAAEKQRRIVPGAPEELLSVPKPSRQAKASADVQAAVVVPEVDYEYVPPTFTKEGKEELSSAELKERIREENKRKAAEAEERKRKRQEAAAKKRQKAAEAARRQEAEAAAREARAHAAAAAAAAAAAEAAAQAAREAAPSGTDGEAEGEAPAVRAGAGRGPAAAAKAPAVSRRPPRLGKAAAKKVTLMEDPFKWAEANTVALACGSVAVLLAIVIILSLMG